MPKLYIFCLNIKVLSITKTDNYDYDMYTTVLDTQFPIHIQCFIVGNDKEICGFSE